MRADQSPRFAPTSNMMGDGALMNARAALTSASKAQPDPAPFPRRMHQYASAKLATSAMTELATTLLSGPANVLPILFNSVCSCGFIWRAQVVKAAHGVLALGQR